MFRAGPFDSKRMPVVISSERLFGVVNIKLVGSHDFLDSFDSFRLGPLTLLLVKFDPVFIHYKFSEIIDSITVL